MIPNTRPTVPVLITLLCCFGIAAQQQTNPVSVSVDANKVRRRFEGRDRLEPCLRGSPAAAL